MIGAFVFGDLAGADASRQRAYEGELPRDQLAAAHALVYAPLRNPDGPPQPQVEYKLRRFVNDYVAPPKSGARLSLAVEAFERMRGDITEMGARTPHELMRCAEVTFIRDCAEMAARSSLARTESRWGLYHERTDHPRRDDTDWLHHLDLRKTASGAMEFTARPVSPYPSRSRSTPPAAARPATSARCTRSRSPRRGPGTLRRTARGRRPGQGRAWRPPRARAPRPPPERTRPVPPPSASSNSPPSSPIWPTRTPRSAGPPSPH